MDSSDMVAAAVVVAGSAVGVAEIVIHGDGTILTAMISIYSLVLGYVFGKSSQPAQKPQTP